MSGQLQQMLDEFSCAVLNYKDNLIHVTLFYREERYNDYLNGKECWAGMGLHNADEVIEFNKLNDNTLIVVQKDGIDTSKYKYVPIFKGTLEYKENRANKTLSFRIRKNQYGNEYNFIDTEGNSENFTSVQAIKDYLLGKYNEVKLPDWSDLMDNMVLIDLETQDFSVHSGIYEVACLVVENYEIVDKLYLGEEIPGYTGQRVYGFGFYDISEDERYINKFKEFMKKYPYPIVAHNCPFDRKFLIYYQWIEPDYPTYCSMRAIRMADNSLGSYALQNLVNHYKVAENVEHTAMSDIENVYKILKIVKPQTWLPVGAQLKGKHYPGRKARVLENIDLNIDATSILDGEVVCFTGKSSYPRATMQEIALKNGAEISEGITSITTMLVVGLDAGSKLDKAQEKGISIISDDEFMRTLNLKGKDIGA